MATTRDQNRAPAGGIEGVNGEFYEGGKFLPTTTLPKRSKPKRASGPRKVEIEPFVWVAAQDGREPILKMVGVQARYVDRYAAKADLKLEPNPAGIAYCGDDFHGVKVADVCAMWNAGERWVATGATGTGTQGNG